MAEWMKKIGQKIIECKPEGVRNRREQKLRGMKIWTKLELEDGWDGASWKEILMEG